MPMDLTDGKSTLVQVMAWCRQATSHYLSQCWPRSLLPYGVLRLLWVNSSPPSGAYMHQWIGWALVQIMACRLFSAIKPLSNPAMLVIVNCTIRNKLQWKFDQKENLSFTKMLLKILSAKRRPSWVNRSVPLPTRQSYNTSTPFATS